MSAILKIDQAGRPAGVAGKARTDGLATGALVTLTNTGTGTTTRFRLLWIPPGDTTAVSTLAVTGNPKVWTFTPTASKPGTYRIELIQDEGQPTEIRERRVFRVRTPNKGLAIPALNEGGDGNASLVASGAPQIEAAEDNSDDWTSDPSLNARRYAAWWRTLQEFILAVDNLSTSGGRLKQLRREVYYTNGNLETYDANNLLVSTVVSSTWTIQSDGDTYRVWVVPGGSSGGTGQRVVSATIAAGGTGAGGGDVGDETFERVTMAAQSPAAVVVGAGAASAAAGALGTTALDGTSGAAGNPSRFGTLLAAYPGGAGRGPTSAAAIVGGGAGGGSLGAGPQGPVTAAADVTTTGGLPAAVANAPGTGHQGAGSTTAIVTSGLGPNGNPSERGGASGGGSRAASNAGGERGGHGGNALRGGPGAGGGGQTGTNFRSGGGNGGGLGARSDGSTVGNGVAGAAQAAGTGAGTDGTDGTAGSVLTCTLGLPGAGGSSAKSDGSHIGVVSGRGGDGGFPGGAGAGSGGAQVSAAATAGFARSGKGADGVVVVVTYGIQI